MSPTWACLWQSATGLRSQGCIIIYALLWTGTQGWPQGNQMQDDYKQRFLPMHAADRMLAASICVPHLYPQHFICKVVLAAVVLSKLTHAECASDLPNSS